MRKLDVTPNGQAKCQITFQSSATCAFTPPLTRSAVVVLINYVLKHKANEIRYPQSPLFMLHYDV